MSTSLDLLSAQSASFLEAIRSTQPRKCRSNLVFCQMIHYTKEIFKHLRGSWFQQVNVNLLLIQSWMIYSVIHGPQKLETDLQDVLEQLLISLLASSSQQLVQVELLPEALELSHLWVAQLLLDQA